MKLNQFRNIMAIAERGSLRGAARHLGLAQPALSRSLQELEHELGVQLFERRARGMILTPMGEALVRRAGNVMTEVRRIGEEIEQLNGGTGGNVSAALSIAAHLALLPKMLPAFRARYPNVELRLIEGTYPSMEASLKDSSIDFYVGPSPDRNLAPELIMEKLFDNKRTILCRKGHPLARAKSLLELAGAEWLTTSISYSAEDELSDLFTRHRLPMPRLALRSQSALTLIVTLASSNLLAMVPVQWAAFPFTVDALVSIDIAEPLPERPISIIRRADFPLTPASQFMVDLVRRHWLPECSALPSKAKRRRESMSMSGGKRRRRLR
jgi:LysR family transcriptional regulator of abg operon